MAQTVNNVDGRYSRRKLYILILIELLLVLLEEEKILNSLDTVRNQHKATVTCLVSLAMDMDDFCVESELPIAFVDDFVEAAG